MSRPAAPTRYVDAIRAGLELAMAADESVCVLGEDVTMGGPFTATLGLLERFGERRVRDTPISEPTIMGLATGAALAGRRPVVEVMFIDFITLGSERPIRRLLAYYAVLVVLVVALVTVFPASSRLLLGGRAPVAVPVVGSKLPAPPDSE